MSSSGNFNSEFDTYLLTSVKYGVQRRMLYKEFSTAMLMLPAAAHRSSLRTCLHQKGKAPGRACSQPWLPREAGALSLWTKQDLGVDRRGCFLIMLLPFHSPCLLQLLLPNNTLSSVTAAVLPLLSDHRPAYTSDSHTLTIIPHCCFLSHLFACLCFFTAPQWANVVCFFFSRVGSTLWNWVGVLYIWWDPQGFSLWKPAYAARAAATGPHGLLSSLISTCHLPVPASFAHDSF